jgi:hypothetical protein
MQVMVLQRIGEAVGELQQEEIDWSYLYKSLARLRIGKRCQNSERVYEYAIQFVQPSRQRTSPGW